jgi:hypothetical protein
MNEEYQMLAGVSKSTATRHLSQSVRLKEKAGESGLFIYDGKLLEYHKCGPQIPKNILK